ncbi:MAG: putative Radial spoke head 10, partial [Streblomastix strix]
MTATFFDILVEPQLLGVTIAEILEGEVFNGKGAVKLVDDHLYKGQFKNGKLHGQGALTWSDGSKFVGEFANNQVIGKGTYTWPDGSKYEGDIKNGQRHGFGTFTSTTGMKYKGDWREGKREGWGVLFYNKEETMFYDGEFHDNVRSGWGRMIYQSHNVYEGRWLNNKRHGLGRMCWNSRGEVFTGNWKDDKQDGIGEHTYHLSNLGQYPFYYSNRYVGFFNQGKRDGPGSFFYADGGRYEGNWTANKKDGAGLLLTSGGQLYEGKFVHDKMTAVTLQQANTIGSAQGKARISTSPEDLIDSEKMKAQATAQQTTADQNTTANTNLISSATGASFSQPDIGISDLIPLYLAPPVVIGHARLIPNTQPGSGASLGLSASTGVGGNERVGQSNSQQQGLMQSAQSVISEVMMLLTRYGQEIKQLYLWLAAQRDYLNPSSTTVSSAAAQIWANPSIKRNSASFQPSPVGKPGQPDLQQSSTNMQSLGSNEGSTVGFQTLGRPNRNYMGTMRTLRGKMTHDGLSPNVLLNMLLNQKKGSNAGVIDRRSLETSLLTASSISLGQGMQQSNQNKQLTHGINIPQLISTPALTTTSPSISVAPSLSSFWLFATLAGFASSPKLTPSPFAIQQQQTAVKQHKNKTSQSNATNQQGG